MNIYFRRAKYN